MALNEPKRISSLPMQGHGPATFTARLGTVWQYTLRKYIDATYFGEAEMEEDHALKALAPTGTSRGVEDFFFLFSLLDLKGSIHTYLDVLALIY